MNYQDFKKYLNEITELTEKEYKKLINLFTADITDKYFELYLNDPTIKHNDETYKKVEYYLEKKNNEDLFNFNEYSCIKDLDITKVYLNDIGQISLLAIEEEKALFNKLEELNNKINAEKITKKRIHLLLTKYNIEIGNNMKDNVIKLKLKMNSSEYTEEQRDKLKTLLKAMNIFIAKESIINLIIQSNLKLVVSIAKNYGGRGVEFLDLIQEGNIGLKKAIEKFDVSKGNKFSTYATYWIRQYLWRGVSEYSHTIKLPIRIQELMKKVSYIEKDLYILLGRRPSDLEVLKLYEEQEQTKKSQQELTMTEKQINEIRQFNQPIKSIYSPLAEYEELLMIDCLEDRENPSLEEQAILNIRKEYLKDIMGVLNKREQLIIVLRHGLELKEYITYEDFKKIIEYHYIEKKQEITFNIDNLYQKLSAIVTTHTYQEIGDILLLTRERVCKLEKRSLNYLYEYSNKEKRKLKINF